MEWSQLDNVRGKRFWSGNTPEAPSFPNQYYPAHGVIAKENGVETLTVYFFCETFDNGADIYVRTKFTEGKPYEFELTTYTTEESDELWETKQDLGHYISQMVKRKKPANYGRAIKILISQNITILQWQK